MTANDINIAFYNLTLTYNPDATPKKVNKGDLISASIFNSLQSEIDNYCAYLDSLTEGATDNGLGEGPQDFYDDDEKEPQIGFWAPSEEEEEEEPPDPGFENPFPWPEDSIIQYALPMSGKVEMLYPYGYTKNSDTNNFNFHKGIDLISSEMSIYCIAYGAVLFCEPEENDEKLYKIAILHRNHYVSIYMHLDASTIPTTLKVGERIEGRAVLGKIKNNAYLHFQISRYRENITWDELYNNYRNPTLFVTQLININKGHDKFYGQDGYSEDEKKIFQDKEENFVIQYNLNVPRRLLFKTKFDLSDKNQSLQPQEPQFMWSKTKNIDNYICEITDNKKKIEKLWDSEEILGDLKNEVITKGKYSFLKISKKFAEACLFDSLAPGQKTLKVYVNISSPDNKEKFKRCVYDKDFIIYTAGADNETAIEETTPKPLPGAEPIEEPEIKLYNLYFCDEKWKILATVPFLHGENSIPEESIPPVPEKPGYTGEWQFPNVFGYSDFYIQPLYTLIPPPAPDPEIIFMDTDNADGLIMARRSYKFGQAFINEPTPPKREGYYGSWSEYALDGKTHTVFPVYTPIPIVEKEQFLIVFRTKYSIIAAITYGEGDNITAPSLPVPEPEATDVEKYIGWEDYTLESESSIIVYAIEQKKPEIEEPEIEPIKMYVITFYTENDVPYAYMYYGHGQTSFSDPLPEVPKKAFHTGVWEDFKLNNSDIKVRPIYTKNKFKNRIIFRNEYLEFLKEVIYDETTVSIKEEEPEVPFKPGYRGEWKYQLKYNENGSVQDITPTYTLIEFVQSDITGSDAEEKDTYYIRFFSDGYLVGYIDYRDNYGPFFDILPNPKKLETSQVNNYKSQWPEIKISKPYSKFTDIHAIHTWIGEGKEPENQYYYLHFYDGLKYYGKAKVDTVTNKIISGSPNPPIHPQQGQGTWDFSEYSKNNNVIFPIFQPALPEPKYGRVNFYFNGKAVEEYGINFMINVDEEYYEITQTMLDNRKLDDTYTYKQNNISYYFQEWNVPAIPYQISEGGNYIIHARVKIKGKINFQVNDIDVAWYEYEIPYGETKKTIDIKSLPLNNIPVIGQYIYQDSQGSYHFAGWEKTSVEVNGLPLTIKAIFTFKPHPLPEPEPEPEEPPIPPSEPEKPSTPEINDELRLTIPLSKNNKTQITSEYGFRRNNEGNLEIHSGIDMVNTDYDVYAAANGKVLVIHNTSPGWEGTGRTITILHDPGNNKQKYVTMYYHLSSIDVTEGDDVTPETKIGVMGSSGGNYGTHLHFQVGKYDDNCETAYKDYSNKNKTYSGLMAILHNNHVGPHKFVTEEWKKIVKFNPSASGAVRNDGKETGLVYSRGFNYFPGEAIIDIDKNGYSLTKNNEGIIYSIEKTLTKYQVRIIDKKTNKVEIDQIKDKPTMETVINKKLYFCKIDTDFDSRCKFSTLSVGEKTFELIAYTDIVTDGRVVYTRDFTVRSNFIQKPNNGTNINSGSIPGLDQSSSTINVTPGSTTFNPKYTRFSGMKYTDKNPPRQMIMINNPCYVDPQYYSNTSKGGDKWRSNIQGVLWHSTGSQNCRIGRYVGGDLPQEDLDFLGYTVSSHWNQKPSSDPKGVHFFIGTVSGDYPLTEDDGTSEITSIQCLPFKKGDDEVLCFGAATLGNLHYYQFEICEDYYNGDAKNPYYNSSSYYQSNVFEEGCQLTAYILKYVLGKGSKNVYDTFKGKHPRETKIHDLPIIGSHSFISTISTETNHGDPDHWLAPGQGYKNFLDKVRERVKEILRNQENKEATGFQDSAEYNKADGDTVFDYTASAKTEQWYKDAKTNSNQNGYKKSVLIEKHREALDDFCSKTGKTLLRDYAAIKHIYFYLRNELGYPKIITCGILGNMMIECGSGEKTNIPNYTLTPYFYGFDIDNDKTCQGNYGLCQWKFSFVRSNYIAHKSIFLKEPFESSELSDEQVVDKFATFSVNQQLTYTHLTLNETNDLLNPALEIFRDDLTEWIIERTNNDLKCQKQYDYGKKYNSDSDSDSFRHFFRNFLGSSDDVILYNQEAGAYLAAYYFCVGYERPNARKNKEDINEAMKNRGICAVAIFNHFETEKNAEENFFDKFGKNPPPWRP